VRGDAAPAETGAGRPRSFWEAYLAGRTGTYEFRSRRYQAVWEALERAGFRNEDILYDVGAGMCEFGRYLFRDCRWHGRYVAVDGAIDGTDLEYWSPPALAHAFVAIEVIEHLMDPARLLEEFERNALKVAVITTPNPATVDVLALDETHVSEVTARQLLKRGWRVHARSLFGKPDDTLVAVWPARAR
jgi:hypothetical protein